MNNRYWGLIFLCPIIAVGIFMLATKTKTDIDHKIVIPVESPKADNNQYALTENHQQEPLELTKSSTQDTETNSTFSKLSAYPGFGHDIDGDEEQFSAEELQRENYIAGCMEENGFEYKPAPSIVIDAEAIDNAEDFDRILQEAAIDPNEAYVSALSSEQIQLYYMTLYGMENPNDPEAQAHEYTDENDSCTSQAFRKIPSVYDKFNALRNEYELMEESVQADERMVQITEAWSGCMGDNGYSFESYSAMARYIDENFSVANESNTNVKAALGDKNTEKLMLISEACKAETNFSEQQKLVRLDHENKFAEEYSDILNAD